MTPAIDTPVAVLLFNRPELTRQVVRNIGQCRPKKILLVADGPRAHRSEEAQLCVDARNAALDAIDWSCDVETHFSDINLGCRNRVSSGLDWVFSCVPRAIVVEDDCVLSLDFFYLCDELLDRYAADSRISQIGACNLQDNKQVTDDSYYFSRYTHVWGWAGWADRWRSSYDVDINSWPDVRGAGLLLESFTAPEEQAFWERTFESLYQNEIDTWDYQWAYANFVQSRLSIVPAVNMVQNIGFGEFATHTTSSDAEEASLRALPLTQPWRHPSTVMRHIPADCRVARKHYWLRRKRRKSWLGHG